MPENIEKLKKLLRADFASDFYLREALTHRSYAVEHDLKCDNQRLEFLGDAVLEIILTDHLFHRYPGADEGELTRMRSGLVRESSLAVLARKIELGSYLWTGKGEIESRGTERDSTLADLFEAVLGAFYLEAGFEAVRPFLIKLVEQVFPDPRSLLREVNPKGALQEYSQGLWGEHPQYSVTAVTGPEHQPTYEVEVHLHGYTAVGRATGRKSAESKAAKALMEFLKQQPVEPAKP